MRRNLGKKPPRVFLNDRRVIEEFLWFPKTLENSNGEDELRWLEQAKIGQRYEIQPFGFNGWSDQAWIDDEWHENFYMSRQEKEKKIQGNIENTVEEYMKGGMTYKQLKEKVKQAIES